jgi:hypothetical protein
VARGAKNKRSLRCGQPDIVSTPLHSTEFGQFYEIRGPLVGPNAMTLQIRSIWMKENVSGVTKFITLTPEK